MRTSKFILYLILSTFLFISCQQVTDPVASKDSNKLKPTDQEIQYQANAILDGTFRLTGEFLTDHDQNVSGKQKVYQPKAIEVTLIKMVLIPGRGP